MDGPFTANNRITKKKKQKINTRCIYQNQLPKPCFQYNLGYGHFEHLPRKTASDKVLCDIAFHMAENPKYDGYQRTLPSMYYKLFDKKSTASYARSGINSISDSEKQK